MLHPVTAAEFAFITGPVASAVPRFYAHERSIFCYRRPESDKRGVKGESKPWTAGFRQKSHSGNLPVFKDKGIFVECMYVKWQYIAID